jgi:hypothetical protein
LVDVRSVPRSRTNPLYNCDVLPEGQVLPLISRTLTPMAQQDKISILGPRDDGTYVVEFRTAAGERLTISVPETKATVLKHFQAATAEPHIPTPDGGVMTGMVKPEIRNVLQIGWTVVRGILELAILIYVLMSMLDPADSIIVAVLGIIYATIRSAALFQHFTITQMAWAGDRQSLEQRLGEHPSVDREIANTDATLSRILLNCYIAGTFIAFQYVVSLTYIFLKL